MAQKVLELNQMTEEAKKTIERMDEGQKMRPKITI